MYFNTGIAPQAMAPQACAPSMGLSPMMSGMGGGLSMMMMQLQQQLMMITTSLLGSMFGNSTAPQGNSSFAGMPNFGAGSGGDPFGLSNFLGQGNPFGQGQSFGPGSFGGPSQGGGGGVSGPRGGGSNNNSGPRPGSGQAGDSKFTTLNVNIKSRPAMSQPKVLHDVRKAAKNADLIGWNEISLDRYRDAIKSLGPEWGHYMPKDGKYQISNPISYKKDEWKLLKGGFEKTHDGAYGICPDRYITWARLKHKGTGEKVVRINTHTVAGAFSKGSSHNGWRRSSWNTHMNKLSNMVRKFESQGYKVIIAGDLNRDSSKVLGNQVAYDNKLNQSTTDGGSTLDYLMHGKNKGLQNLNAGVLGGFNSDHHAVYGTYNLGRR